MTQRASRFGFNTHGNMIPLPRKEGQRPNITIIVAMDNRGGIGKNNQIPWAVSADMLHFKRLTEGHAVIMGRKTYQSLKFRPSSNTRALPNRTNIVLSQEPGFFLTEPVDPPNMMIADDLGTAVSLCTGHNQIFVIGGAQIYKEALDRDLVDDMVITRFSHNAECDTFFPALEEKMWIPPAFSTHDLGSGLSMRFEYWRRIKKE